MLNRRQLLGALPALSLPLPALAAELPLRKVGIREMFEHRIVTWFEHLAVDKPEGAVVYMSGEDGCSVIAVLRGLVNPFDDTQTKVLAKLGVWTTSLTGKMEKIVDGRLEVVLESAAHGPFDKPVVPRVEALLEEASEGATLAYFLHGNGYNTCDSWVLSRGPVGILFETADRSKRGIVVFQHKILRIVSPPKSLA